MLTKQKMLKERIYDYLKAIYPAPLRTDSGLHVAFGASRGGVASSLTKLEKDGRALHGARCEYAWNPECEKAATQPEPAKPYPFDDTHHFPKQEPPSPNEAPPGYDRAQNEKPEEPKEAPQPGQQLIPLTEGDLQAVGPDGKRRLPTLRLGQRLGYARDYAIRDLIKRRRQNLEKAGPLIALMRSISPISCAHGAPLGGPTMGLIDWIVANGNRLLLVGTVILVMYVIPVAIAYLDERGGPRGEWRRATKAQGDTSTSAVLTEARV
jgi:hypothetical protein